MTINNIENLESGASVRGKLNDVISEVNNLGTAATRDVTQSPTDTTFGRLTKVGDYGWGGQSSVFYPLNDVDADPNSVPNGTYRIDSTNANRPFGLSGTVLVQHYNSGEVAMLFMSRGENSFVANRYYISGWTDWKRLEPERGSNSNGQFVRFADGTQICTHRLVVGDVTNPTGGLFRSNQVTWTFPAAFAVAPRGLSSNDVGSQTITSFIRAASASTANVNIVAWVSVSNTRSADVMAVGRWF